MKAETRARHGLFEVLEVRCLLSINPITSTLTPTEIYDSYGLDDVTFGPVGSASYAHGEGETIAVIEAGDDTNFVNTTDSKATTTYPLTYGRSDLAMFNSQFNIDFSTTFKVVGETGGARPNFEQDPAANPVNNYQTALDVEWAHAMAPLATIDLIETTTESDSDFMTAVTAGVAAVGAEVVLLTGYGNFESTNNANKLYELGDLPPSLFNQPGVTFIDGSGDEGAPGLALGDYPDVVSVAASNTTLNNDGKTFEGNIGSWSNDTGWSNPPGGVNGQYGGSGGGYTDDIFPTPTYQQGLVISDGNQTVSSFGERTIPDVSFPGGNNGLPYVSGGAVLNTATDGGVTFDGEDGTELAADSFASLVAVADQGLRYDGDAPLDSYQTLTGLYNAPSYDFHDITSGFNGFAAGAGYDLVSGLGTPIANQLVPDLAKFSGTATNPVWTGLDFEAPEAYAAGATNPTPDYLTLELGTIKGVSSIELYNSSTSTSLGTLVASDPLSSTSVININGAANATNSLTIDFTNGNPIPLGGIAYDGAPLDDDGLPAGSISLTLQGQLPAIAGTPPASTGQLSSGLWSTEVARPTGPNSGLISLGGLFNINYYNVTQNIHDMTPATNASFTALGSNTEDVLLNIGPSLPVSPGSTATLPSTQVSSSTSTPGQFEFVLVDFINKTGVTLGDSDGNDTLILNFGLGNPLPPSGLTFNGGTGTNSVQVTGSGNYTLGANATITNTTVGGGGLSLINEQHVSVTGTTGDQYFTVTNWLSATGQPIPLTINGGTGHDQVYVRQNANFTVNGASNGTTVVTTNTQLTLTMLGISYLELYNTNAGGSFNVNSWLTGDGLGLYLIGSSGPNTFNISSAANPLGLDAVSAPVTVIAQGGKYNTLNLNDQGSSGFNDYTLSQNSITSTFDPIEGSTRPFRGVSMVNFTSTSLPTVIQTVNLNPDAVGSTFNVTPNANTQYYINGSASPQGLLNTLNLPASGPLSPTLFMTSGPSFVSSLSANNTGFFMFANDKGVNFQNMQATNFTGSVGAITAVAGTAGVSSQPIVNIINSVTGQILQTIPLSNIYPANYTGGIQVALGDVTGSGVPNLIVAPGVGTTPIVGVYNILNGSLIESFLAQNSSYNYGLRVAVGDVTGDGKQDLITAPLVGPANVNVFVNTGNSTAPFNAYTTSTPTIKAFSNITGYQGGVGGITVGSLTPGAAGDIVIGSGVGTPANAQVYTFNSKTSAGTLVDTITPLFSAMVSGGISVAVADVTGDGVPDLVMGAGTNAASQVDVFNGATQAQNQFTAFTGAGSTAAVHVAIAKISGGVDDILVSQSTGGQSHQIKTFTAAGAAVGTAFAETQSWLLGGINLD